MSKFNSLYNYGNISSLIKIDALETIGISLTSSTDDTSLSITFWDLSLDLRSKHELKKKVRVIGNQFMSEFTTIYELNKIEHDPIELQMQCLIMIDRILDKYHK